MKPRGFATLSPERLQEISRKGGKAVHAMGLAHRFAAGSMEARLAGKKGGIEVHRRKRCERDTDPCPEPEME